MKWIAVIARTILGLLYLMGAVTYFFNMMGDAPPMEGHAKAFTSAIGSTGFLTVVKIIEAIGGVLLVSGQFVRFAAILVFPVTINILLFSVLIAQMNPAMPLAMLLLNLFLFFYYREDAKVLLKR